MTNVHSQWGLDADAPARFVGRDHRRVADLPAEFPVDRRGVAGGSMQQMNEAAGGDLQAEPRPQQAGDLGQRHAHLGVQLDDERGEAGTELHRGRPERVGYLEAVPPLHALAALRAAADLDVEAAHDRVAPWGVLPDTARRRGSLRRRRRSRDTPSAPTPCGSRRPSRRATSGTLPAVLRPGPSAWAPAYLSLAAGPWQRVQPAVCPARRASSSCFLRSSLRRFQRSRSRVVRSRSRVVRSRSRVVRSRSRVVRSRSRVVRSKSSISLAFSRSKLLDALVPRILLSPGYPRTAASAALASHALRIGRCPPNLHTISRIFSLLPGNQRRADFPHPALGRDIMPSPTESSPEAGVFEADPRLELIDRGLHAKTPEKAGHATGVHLAADLPAAGVRFRVPRTDL